MKFLFLLLAAQVIQSMTIPATPRCKREIVESYNLNGYITQRDQRMYLCPEIKSTCCSIFDQFQMYSNWKDKIKPKLTKYYDGILRKLNNLKKLILQVNQIDIKKHAKHLTISDAKRGKLLMAYEKLKKENIELLFSRLMSMSKDSSEYMMGLRSSFYCVICDFKSHKYIEIPQKKIKFNSGFCKALADNTINFAYFLNIKLVPFLIELSKITSVFGMSESDKPLKLKNFKKLKNHVKGCARSVKKGIKVGTKCKKYCNHYKLNANSPVLEGYSIFMNEAANMMLRFVKNYGKKDRILELKESLKKDLPKERKLAQDPHAILSEVDYDPDVLQNLKDPYDGGTEDPRFDSYSLNKMFNFQVGYEKDRQKGYVNFIKNKLHYFDVEYDFENADEDDIFKTNTKVVVDLENYDSVFGAHGIDVNTHAEKTNIDEDIKNLVSHIKNKSQFKILYEKLDPNLVEQLNDVGNADVEHFHRDNFLRFKDFKLYLKRDEMMGRLDSVKHNLSQQYYVDRNYSGGP